ncbi:hypothetical protein C8034_v009012 [Colletotrichum sidae]|uniref:Uncharacterized protein n=3 Tax=Colletotrichum orbiculare species complex TaxID=2707354 RepID=N4VNK2_COLOR|nr:hypothetical protein Cob_v001318 [Colletotrichum orbiculare MAFF 240422]TDZ35460.1 hypothetical protein C8035_v009331 [Colletotrichum spinosum]TEA19662.1 hypothetical protein C8034_v009012 [Colletotrichum sidae]
MQFPTLALIATLMAGSASAAITYSKASYVSVCTQGENLFCTGDVNICPKGSREFVDAKATKANEEACKGLKRNDGCVVTHACEN